MFTGKDFQVQIKVMGQGDYRYEMTQVSSQEFQDVREKIYDCVSVLISILIFLGNDIDWKKIFF